MNETLVVDKIDCSF